MPVERRERVIAIWLGSTGNGRNPMFNGARQPSRGGTSRMMREYQVRFCERLGAKFPGPTRPWQAFFGYFVIEFGTDLLAPRDFLGLRFRANGTVSVTTKIYGECPSTP